MADFSSAFEKVLVNEGGYANDPDDRGGETYKGIARKFHSKWEGWARIDAQKNDPEFPANLTKDETLQSMIKEFYETNFWDAVRGDEITNQAIAESIFDFAVNAGIRTSSKLAQKVVGAVTDGVIGQKTLAKLNAVSEDEFRPTFSLAKIARYVYICEKNPKQKKFFFGWIQRTLKGV